MKAPRAAVKNRRREYRGVAQLVARHIWDVDAVGSNPATPTNPSVHMDTRIFYFLNVVMNIGIRPSIRIILGLFQSVACTIKYYFNKVSRWETLIEFFIMRGHLYAAERSYDNS